MKTPTLRELFGMIPAVRRNEKTAGELSNAIATAFLSKCMLFIAVVMIIYGAAIGYLVLIGQYTNEFVTALDIISMFLGEPGIEEAQTSLVFKLPPAVAYILCGVLIFLDCRRNFIKSVGLYMFSVGFARAYTSLPLLVSQSEPTFVSGLVMIALGGNLCFSGYSMLSGKVRGRNTQMATSIILLVIYLEYLALLMYIDVDTEYIPVHDAMADLFQSYPTMIISVFMYLFLIWLLDSDEIRYGDYLTRHVRIMEYVDNTYRTPEELKISEETAAILLDPGAPGWYDPADGGPVEREYMFQSYSSLGSARIYVQKWKGSERLRLTICGTPEGSLVYAKRLEIIRIFEPAGGLENAGTLDIMVDGGMILHAEIIRRKEGCNC